MNNNLHILRKDIVEFKIELSVCSVNIIYAWTGLISTFYLLWKAKNMSIYFKSLKSLKIHNHCYDFFLIYSGIDSLAY